MSLERDVKNYYIGNKEVRVMSQLERFYKEETGMGVVEVVLIIVVLVGLVVIFNEEITDLVSKIFKSINKSAKKII